MGHAVYVTLLAESHSRMFAHLRRMAFFDESAIPDRVYYIGGYSALEAEGLDALVTLIRLVNRLKHRSGRGFGLTGVARRCVSEAVVSPARQSQRSRDRPPVQGILGHLTR